MKKRTKKAKKISENVVEGLSQAAIDRNRFNSSHVDHFRTAPDASKSTTDMTSGRDRFQTSERLQNTGKDRFQTSENMGGSASISTGGAPSKVAPVQTYGKATVTEKDNGLTPVGKNKIKANILLMSK